MSPTKVKHHCLLFEKRQAQHIRTQFEHETTQPNAEGQVASKPDDDCVGLPRRVTVLYTRCYTSLVTARQNTKV